MKKNILVSISLLFFLQSGFSQADTISQNIYGYIGKLGIGINTPQNALSIVGNETEWPGRVMFSINNINTSGKSLAYMELKAGSSGNHTILGHISETYTSNSQPGDLQDYSLLSSNGKGVIIGAFKNDLSPGIIKFFNGQNPDNSFIETMRIAENGNIGIGTNDPRVKLHIRDINSQLYFGYQPAYNGPYINLIGETAGSTPMLAIGLAQSDYDYNGEIIAKANWGYIYGNLLNEGIAILPSLADAPSGFYINKSGKVGIGTAEPEAKLHVADGDIYISDIDRGIIMKSPDGHCWRGVLNNHGSLVFSQISCNDVSSSIQEPGFDSQGQSAKITVSPNPSDGNVYIDKEKYTDNKSLNYLVYNLNGQYLTGEKVKSDITKVNLSGFPAGSYIIRILDEDQNIILSEQIIKQ